MLKITRRFLVVFTVVLGCLGADANADTVRTVAFSGTPAPGTNASFSFRSAPLLNNAGQVAFSAFLLGPEISRSNNTGIWSDGSGALTLVARKGDEAPGASDDFSFFYPIDFNDAGQTAFTATFGSGGIRNSGIWSDRDGTLGFVVRSGDVAPGTSESFYSLAPRPGREFPALNDAGQVVFHGGISGGAGIWSEGSGSLALIARHGNVAPGTDAMFSQLNIPVFNNAGRTAFSAFLIGPEVDSSNNGGVWAERNGALSLVLREGDKAPGTNADFSHISQPLFNNASQIAFPAWLVGPGVDDSNNRGIWSERSGSLALVAREGDEAPGTSDVFSLLNPPAFNDAGHTVFSATLGSRGIGKSGIWSDRDGTLGLVVRAGETAPGTHATFSSFGHFTPALNESGHVAFSRFLDGPGDKNFGIWAENSFGVLTLIVRRGDQLDVADGPVPDLRTINSLSFGADGFNDRGQVAFIAEFTDGSSGIFVSNLAAVPEPSSLLLLGVIGIGLLSGGRGPKGGGRCRGARTVGR